MATGADPRVSVSVGPTGAILVLAGRWAVADGIPALEPLEQALAAEPRPARLSFEASGLEEWDSALVAYLLAVSDLCRTRDVALDQDGLPAAPHRLLDLVEAVPERDGAVRHHVDRTLLARLERPIERGLTEARGVVAFLGELAEAAFRLLSGRSRFPPAEFWLQVELAGAAALPIVGIISFLVGLIIGFVGAVQLRQFGAGLYIANLVGLAVAREMAPVMTAVVLAGRTGAAYAAELGAMESNEEVDALSVLGIAAVDYLVLPRLLAITLMMPLLCLYADLLGMVGGYAVGSAMLGITGKTFLHQLDTSLPFIQIAIGLFKSLVFGIIIAIAGCFHGLTAGRSAAEVGSATTAAVVDSILWVIVADGVFAVLLQEMHL